MLELEELSTSPAVITLDGEDDQLIPDPFPFPKHYTPDIEIGLQTKNLPSKLQAKFYTRIANVMFMYTKKPRAAEFEEVARQIVKKYPFLVSPLDTCGHVRFIHSMHL